jgi:SAM-dependent methyltransferase
MPANEWMTPERVLNYLDRADRFPHRAEGESVLFEHVPDGARRVLDLGTGDGRLLALLKRDRPEIVGVGVDFSEVMLDAARKRDGATGRRQAGVVGLVERLSRGEVSPEDDAGLTRAGIVGVFRGRHVERAVKGDRIVVGGGGDRLEGRGATVAGERLKLAVQPSSEAGSPRIGTDANEMHVTNSSRDDESEEIRRHAAAAVPYYQGGVTELVNEHRMVPRTHVALAPVLGKRVDDRVVVGGRGTLGQHRKR